MKDDKSAPGGILGRIVDRLVQGSTAVAGVALLLMGFLIASDVVGRYVLHSPITFADEVSEYLLAIITFLGLGYALKKGAHVRVTIITDKLPKKARIWLELVTTCIALIYVGLFAFYSIMLVKDSYEIQAVSIVMRAKLYIVQAVMPVGLVLFSLLLVAQIISKIRDLQRLDNGHIPSEGRIVNIESSQ